MHDNIFEGMDFGPLKEYLENDDVTDISYSNGCAALKLFPITFEH